MSHYRSECSNCGEYAYLNDDGLCGPDVNDCAAALVVTGGGVYCSAYSHPLRQHVGGANCIGPIAAAQVTQ